MSCRILRLIRSYYFRIQAVSYTHLIFDAHLDIVSVRAYNALNDNCAGFGELDGIGNEII